MKKLKNDVNMLVYETLEGYALIHKDIIEHVQDTHLIVRKNKKGADKVKFIIANGAGHEPAVIGWVGEGMFDMNIVGEVFTAPSADKILEGIEYINDGSPILLVIQNHAGDVLNGNLAFSMALDKDINIRKVLFYDDVASAPKGMEEERRGVGGMLFYTKIVGALLETGADINAAIDMFEKCRDNTRTYAVAFTSCTHPVTGLTMVSTKEDEIELGMGVHGEGSSTCIPMPLSKDFAKIVADKLIEDKPYAAGDEVLVFINGLGSLTMMEQSILYNDIVNYLEGLGIKVYSGFSGNCLTTQELSGLSLSICKVDEEMKRLWDMPCRCGIFAK